MMLSLPRSPGRECPSKGLFADGLLCPPIGITSGVRLDPVKGSVNLPRWVRVHRLADAVFIPRVSNLGDV